MTTSYDEFDTVWAPPDKAVDDNGATHDSIQDAVDNADDFVVVGPGTFGETVLVDKEGLEMRGAGTGTVIDGTPGRALDISADDVNVSDMAVQNDVAGASNNNETVRVRDGSADGSLENIRAFHADGQGFRVIGENWSVRGCVATDTQSDAFQFTGSSRDCSVIGCVCYQNIGGAGYQLSGERETAVGCIAKDTAGSAFFTAGQNNAYMSCIGNDSDLATLRDIGAGNIFIGCTSTNPVGDHYDFSGATNTIALGNNPGDIDTTGDLSPDASATITETWTFDSGLVLGGPLTDADGNTIYSLTDNHILAERVQQGDGSGLDSDSVDGYDIQKNGTDGAGIINFKTP